MRINDSPGERKSETGAFSGRLGGEERIEDPGKQIVRNSLPGVGDRNLNAVTFEPTELFRSDADLSVGRRGCDRVAEQIEERGFDLRWGTR